MSHIAFELDALPLVPKVARSAGLSEGVIGWGLVQLWEWCWREKTDHVSSIHLRGFFGVDTGESLAAFGFLEAVDNGWRVRGAARYLRIQEGRSRGGKLAAGNLKQNRKNTGMGTGSAPAPVRLPSGSPPAGAPADDRAFSDERLATSDKLLNPSPDKRAPKPKKPVDPRYGPLVGRLKALTLEHTKTDAFTNADGAALKTLIGRGELDEEIITRFTRGLTADRYSPKCATVMQLLQRWPELGIVRAAGPPSRADPNDDIVRSTGEPCVICGSRDTAGAGNIFACYASHLAPASAEADRLVPSMPWLADLRPWVESMRGAP